jgi:hypothetical protein
MQGKAESELKKLRKDKDPRIQARAFYLLSQIKGKEQQYIDEALKDKNEDIRCAALRELRSGNMDATAAVKQLAHDSSAAVRRECALSLRHSKSSEAPALWTELAKQYDGKDRWYLEALGIGADKNEDAFFDAWLASVGDKWNSGPNRDIVWRSRAKKTPGLLAKIVTDKSTPEADKARYMRAMDFQKGPEKEQALVEILTGSK